MGRAKARKSVRHASAAMQKAMISGSKTALRLARRRLQEAKSKSDEAEAATREAVKQKQLRQYEKALRAGGSPTGGGPVQSQTTQAISKYTFLVRKASETG